MKTRLDGGDGNPDPDAVVMMQFHHQSINQSIHPSFSPPPTRGLLMGGCTGVVSIYVAIKVGLG